MPISSSKTNFFQASLLAQDVKLEEKTRVYDGHFKVDKLKLRFKQFAGNWSESVFREQITRANAAALLLYDPQLEKVVLVEQLRIGLVGESLSSPWMLEIVAGLIHENEDPLATVLREAVEEAGCEVTDAIPICEFYNTPGALTERTWVYCALIDSKHLGGVFGVPHEHEDIKVHVLPAAEVFKGLDEGLFITSASTVIALQWLEINLNRFKETRKL